MKLSEMNAHQRLAFETIKDAMSEFIGGYENALEDYSPEDEEYKEAKAFLSSGHDNLVDVVYDDVMARSDSKARKNLRFAGEAFVRERISKRLEKWGY